MGKVFKALKKAAESESSGVSEVRKQEKAAVESEEIAIEPKQVAVESEEMAVEPEQVAVASEEVAVEPEQVAVASEEVAVEPEQVAVEPKRVETATPEQEQNKPDRLTVQPVVESQVTDATVEEQLRPGQWDERLTLATAMTGSVAESIRSLRTRVLYPLTGNPPRSLLITSASPGEGKSFICANLGISLAQGVDNYSLIVDCDLRRPSQHKLFGLGNNRGLVDYLHKTRKLDEVLTRSGVDKLTVIPAGPPPVNPSELLGSSTMITLVEELVERYEDRIVLFDSPPLHSAAETAVLAQRVDGVVLVVRYGGARREHIKALIETIGKDKIVGVVFNAYRSNVLDTKVFGYYEHQKKYYYEEK